MKVSEDTKSRLLIGHSHAVDGLFERPDALPEGEVVGCRLQAEAQLERHQLARVAAHGGEGDLPVVVEQCFGRGRSAQVLHAAVDGQKPLPRHHPLVQVVKGRVGALLRYRASSTPALPV